MNKSKIYPEERLLKIMEILKANNSVDVDSLSHLFQVTGATIRADLRELEGRSLITKTHGGAILKENMEDILKTGRDLAYGSRIQQNALLKEAIGVMAASIINHGDSIMLDDGSTTLQVARHLPYDVDVTVITNGLNICLELAEHQNANVIMTGGNLNKVDLSFHGRVAEEAAARYHANKAILGASGISLANGITAPDDAKAELKKIMIKNSTECIIVADHTKLNRISLVPVCLLQKVTTIITDSQASIEVIEQLRGHDIKILIAQ